MATVIEIAIAVAIGLGILLLGRWGVKLLAAGGPPDIDPDSVVDVEIRYECIVCGMRLTVTQAQDEELVAPRHCHEEMVLVSGAEGA